MGMVVRITRIIEDDVLPDQELAVLARVKNLECRRVVGIPVRMPTDEASPAEQQSLPVKSSGQDERRKRGMTKTPAGDSLRREPVSMVRIHRSGKLCGEESRRTRAPFTLATWPTGSVQLLEFLAFALRSIQRTMGDAMNNVL